MIDNSKDKSQFSFPPAFPSVTPAAADKKDDKPITGQLQWNFQSFNSTDKISVPEVKKDFPTVWNFPPASTDKKSEPNFSYGAGGTQPNAAVSFPWTSSTPTPLIVDKKETNLPNPTAPAISSIPDIKTSFDIKREIPSSQYSFGVPKDSIVPKPKSQFSFALPQNQFNNANPSSVFPPPSPNPQTPNPSIFPSSFPGGNAQQIFQNQTPSSGNAQQIFQNQTPSSGTAFQFQMNTMDTTIPTIPTALQNAPGGVFKFGITQQPTGTNPPPKKKSFVAKNKRKNNQ